MKHLLNHNANVYAIDNIGYSPLHWAIQNHHDSCVTVLLEAGFDLSASNNLLLHFAVTNGNASIVSKLIQHGAKVNAPNDYGRCRFASDPTNVFRDTNATFSDHRLTQIASSRTLDANSGSKLGRIVRWFINFPAEILALGHYRDSSNKSKKTELYNTVRNSVTEDIEDYPGVKGLN